MINTIKQKLKAISITFLIVSSIGYKLPALAQNKITKEEALDMVKNTNQRFNDVIYKSPKIGVHKITGVEFYIIETYRVITKNKVKTNQQFDTFVVDSELGSITRFIEPTKHALGAGLPVYNSSYKINKGEAIAIVKNELNTPKNAKVKLIGMRYVGDYKIHYLIEIDKLISYAKNIYQREAVYFVSTDDAKMYKARYDLSGKKILEIYEHYKKSDLAKQKAENQQIEIDGSIVLNMNSLKLILDSYKEKYGYYPKTFEELKSHSTMIDDLYNPVTKTKGVGSQYSAAVYYENFLNRKYSNDYPTTILFSPMYCEFSEKFDKEICEKYSIFATNSQGELMLENEKILSIDQDTPIEQDSQE